MSAEEQETSIAVNLEQISVRSVARVIVFDTINNISEIDLPAIEQTLDELQGPEGQVLVLTLFNQYLGLGENDQADERVLDACPECIEVEDLHAQMILLFEILRASLKMYH